MEKENKGVLFKVQEKKSDKHPDFTGKCNVNGKEMSIGAWLNTSKDGQKKYLSLSFSEYTPKESSYNNDNVSMTDIPL